MLNKVELTKYVKKNKDITIFMFSFGTSIECE